MHGCVHNIAIDLHKLWAPHQQGQNTPVAPPSPCSSTLLVDLIIANKYKEVGITMYVNVH